MKPISAGSEIDAWCTRCRLDLGHRVVAMVGHKPERAVCLTCGSEHKYRPPKGAAGALLDAKAAPRQKAAAPGSKAPKAKSASTARTTAGWETLCGGRAETAFAPYQGTRRYREGDLVTHSRFGRGAVIEALDGSKVRIIFRDGERTLVHGR